jgi:AAA domain
MDLSEYQDNMSTKVLVYGPPKAGKTDLVGQLAEVFTLHWLDLEHGIRTLLNKERFNQAWLKNVNYFNIPDHVEYPIAITTVQEILKGGLKKICQDHGVPACARCQKDPKGRWSEVDIMKFTSKDILVIDSATQLGRSAINKSALKGIQAKGPDYKFERDDFGAQGRALDLVFNKFQVLPINIAVISHEMDGEKEPDKAEKLVPISGTANHSKTVSKYFDELAYCYVQNGRHRVANSTTFRPGVQTGGRSGVKLDTMEVPSLVPLFDPSRYEEFAARKAGKP